MSFSFRPTSSPPLAREGLRRHLVAKVLLGAALTVGGACASGDGAVNGGTGGSESEGTIGTGGQVGGASGGQGTGGQATGGQTTDWGTGGGSTTGSGGSTAGGSGGSTAGSGGSTAGSGGSSVGSGGSTAGGSGGSSAGSGGSSAGRGGSTAGNGGSTAGGSGGSSAGGSGSHGDGGSVGGPSAGGCPAGALLCEGFETYPANAAPAGLWTHDLRNAGQINVASDRPFSGKQSIHVTGKMSSDRANIQMPLPIAAATVFVRFMMYTASYPSSSGVHTRLVRLGTQAGAAAGSPDSSYSFANYNGTAIEKVNSIYLRTTSTHLDDAAVKGRWVCWEFEVDKTGGAGKVQPHIWLDGRELTLAAAGSSSHGMTPATWDPIPIEVLILGLEGYQPDAVLADFWIDDLVVNSQRVGCPSAH